MSVHSGRSICVCVCVYVKHISTFLAGGNTVPLAFQQLAREGALIIAAVIHTERTARTEKFQDSANHKKINTNYRLRKEVKHSESAQEYRERHQPERWACCCCVMHLQGELVDIFCWSSAQMEGWVWIREASSLCLWVPCGFRHASWCWSEPLKDTSDTTEDLLCEEV